MTYLCGAGEDGAVVARAGATTRVAVDPGEPEAVHRAVRHLVADLARVTGARCETVADACGAQVVVGTWGVSRALSRAAGTGAFDPGPLLRADGGPVWEAFTVQEHAGVVHLAGADRRGTVYAVYDLCTAAGVSPWHWWADVPVRPRERVAVRRGTVHADRPAVRYRGVFVNDEEQLHDWAVRHTDDGCIGPAVYGRLFELLLRLKANYLWPAMHTGAFNADPRNGALADAMGVVIGTSHCDMLLRSNEHEWQPWLDGRGLQVAYDFSYPHAREVLRDYWRGSVRQNAAHEVTWSVGMRGVHDSGFVTGALDADPALVGGELLKARVELLGEVVREQRALLGEVLGARAGAAAPQVFVPYKEALTLYDAGLDVPDDVTLVWTDDNFGRVRRLPTAAERARSGGHGLYYHSSYWSPPPLSYLFISSMQLQRMQNELRRAFEGGVDRLWVDNVGAVKPLERDVEYFIACAWEAGRWTTTGDTVGWLRSWFARQVPAADADELAALDVELCAVADVRKVEHLGPDAFVQTGPHGDEQARRVALLRALCDRYDAVVAGLDRADRDCLHELLGLRLHAAYLVNAQFHHADRSRLQHARGAWRGADLHVALARAHALAERTLVQHYGEVVAGGRWSGLVRPHDFAPPVSAQFADAVPALHVGPAQLGVAVRGDAGAAWAPPGGGVAAPAPLVVHQHTTQVPWFDVMNRGTGTLTVHLRCDPWLSLVGPDGVPLGPGPHEVAVERRVGVVVDAAAHPGRTGEVVVRRVDDGAHVRVAVQVAAPAPGAAPVPGAWLEADAVVSVPACGWARRRSGAGGGPVWAAVPLVGRSGASVVQLVPGPQPAQTPGASDAPGASHAPGAVGASGGAVLEYDVHLCTPGAHLLQVHRHPTLDSTGRIRVAVAVDDGPAVVLESPTTDEHRGAWLGTVLEGVERLQLRLPYLDAGPHTLRLVGVDLAVAVEALVVCTAAGAATGTLAPAPSRRADGPDGPDGRRGRGAPRPGTGPAVPVALPAGRPDPCPAALAPHEVLGWARRHYGIDPCTVPGPPVLHMGRDAWPGATAFTRCLSAPQGRGPARHAPGPDGAQHVTARLGTGAVLGVAGVVAFEAELALAQDRWAWTTPDLHGATWTQLAAPTDGGTGLAMWVDRPGSPWTDPGTAPGLHVRVVADRPGPYRAWLLARFTDGHDDACLLAVDGVVVPAARQWCSQGPDWVPQGHLHTFGAEQQWVWQEICDLPLDVGEHVVSVLAVTPRLRVDRVFLTTGHDLPPGDDTWAPSPRGGR